VNRIVLLGQRDLATDETILPQRDYGLILTASRISEEKMDDEEDTFKYRLKILHIDNIFDLREQKQVKFNRGKSPSQKLRWLIVERLGEADYENFIGYLMGRIDELTESYKEQL
jgi:hypothetical protein